MFNALGDGKMAKFSFTGWKTYVVEQHFEIEADTAEQAQQRRKTTRP